METPKARENLSLYNAWNGMFHRCNDEKNKFYNRYGGRGIKVSDSWKDFGFFVSDMKVGWQKGLTLERVDNDGPYSKENCRWASREEQANNRNTTRLISYKGESRTLPQWAKLLGIKSSTVRQRFYVYRWPVKRCLS